MDDSGDNQIPSSTDEDSKSSRLRGRKRSYISSVDFADDGEKLEKMARRVIEEAMTKAVVRKCWKCKRRFVKDGGCNAVSCVCGGKTCFACREPITDGLLNGLTHLWCFHRDFKERKETQKAADNAKAYLRGKYPKLTFKYDPSTYDPST